jgi:hypothetical protein
MFYNIGPRILRQQSVRFFAAFPLSTFCPILDHFVASSTDGLDGLHSGNNLEMTPLISQAKDTVITLHYVGFLYRKKLNTFYIETLFSTMNSSQMEEDQL